MELRSTDVEVTEFSTAMRGYDRDEVNAFVQRVARAMADLEERVNIATTRAERLDKELRDLRRADDRAAQVYAEAVVAKEDMLARAAAEAADIVAAARERAATATDAGAAIEAAEARAAEIESEARREAEAMATAAAIGLEEARKEADRLVAAARERAQEEARRILTDAEAEHAELTAALRQLRGLVADLEARAATAIDRPAALTDVEIAIGEAEEVSVDLRDRLRGTPAAATAMTGERTTRYRSRSAGLPTIGADAENMSDSLRKLRPPADD